MLTSISNIDQYSKVALISQKHTEARNPLTVCIHEFFNYFRAFLLPYEGWMNQIYYACKHMGFTLRDILYEIPYYELLWLIDKWKEELEEKAKHDEEERARQEAEMHKMHSSMSRMQKQQSSSYSQPNFSMPAMPKI